MNILHGDKCSQYVIVDAALRCSPLLHTFLYYDFAVDGYLDMCQSGYSSRKEYSIQGYFQRQS